MSNDVDELDTNINKDLERIQKDLESLSTKDLSQKQNAIKKLQTQLKNVKTQIETYDIEISCLDKSISGKYQEQLKQIKAKNARLKQEFEFKKNEGTNQEELFRDRLQPTNPENLNATELIELGTNIQNQGTEKLKDIEKIIEQGTIMAEEINQELDKQIAQLDRMQNTVKDTQMTLKRTSNYLRYFARQIYTDKCIMCLICLIFLVIVGLIVASALGYDNGELNTPDIVKKNSSSAN